MDQSNQNLRKIYQPLGPVEPESDPDHYIKGNIDLKNRLPELFLICLQSFLNLGYRDLRLYLSFFIYLRNSFIHSLPTRNPVSFKHRRGPGYANTAVFWVRKKSVNFFSGSQPPP